MKIRCADRGYMIFIMKGLQLTLRSSLRKAIALAYLGMIGVIFGLCLGVGILPVWLITRLF